VTLHNSSNSRYVTTGHDRLFLHLETISCYYHTSICCIEIKISCLLRIHSRAFRVRLQIYTLVYARDSLSTRLHLTAVCITYFIIVSHWELS
jgi:hypothetical protein